MAEEIRNNPQNTAAEPQLSEILQVRRDKLKTLQDAGNDPFRITKFDVSHHAEEIRAQYETLENQEVTLAGRMMAKRVMGKASFAHIQDLSGKMQLYIARDSLGEEPYAGFKKLDIGDIIGIKGEVFRTKMGELSVRATELTLLSKSLLPLPEKFHGLTSTELRFRQRYVDLMVNPEVKRNFVIRSQFIKFMRNYLDNMNYIEVETPVLNTIAGGAAARPFITHHNTLDIDMFMRIATELPLKRLIIGGMDRVYEIGRIFRNEGMDPKHNPEFTSVELYQAYADFHDMMDIAEGIISGAAQEILGTYEIEWMGEKIDLTPGWRRLTMVDAVKEYVGIDFGAITDDAEAVAAAKAKGVELADAAALDAFPDVEGAEPKPEPLSEEKKPELDALVAAVKEILGDQVKDVRVTERPIDAPACLVSADGVSSSMEKLMRVMQKSDGIPQKIFELNPDHSLVRALMGICAADASDPMLKDMVNSLFDSTLLLDGYMNDPFAMAERSMRLLKQAAGWYSDLRK